MCKSVCITVQNSPYFIVLATQSCIVLLNSHTNLQTVALFRNAIRNMQFFYKNLHLNPGFFQGDQTSKHPTRCITDTRVESNLITRTGLGSLCQKILLFIIYLVTFNTRNLYPAVIGKYAGCLKSVYYGLDKELHTCLYLPN